MVRKVQVGNSKLVNKLQNEMRNFLFLTSGFSNTLLPVVVKLKARKLKLDFILEMTLVTACNCIINEFFRRQAEQEARRKALIAGMKDKKKRFEVRAYENDGWCKMLQIWRPKATVDAGFIKEKNVKSKWFRDPNTDQERSMICLVTWVSRTFSQRSLTPVILDF